MTDKETLIARILAIEEKMFLSVPTAEPAPCQQHPEQFRLHRRSQFHAWNEDVLTSYLEDLNDAMKSGENLMTRKYARMDNLIPPREHHLIDEIVAIKYAWQKAMFENYPGIMNGARSLSRSEDTDFRTSFETYLRAELETYSDETIRLLHAQVMEMLRAGRSMAEEIYSFLIREQGFSSLDEAELLIRTENSW